MKTLLQLFLFLALAGSFSLKAYAQTATNAKAVTDSVKDATPATAITATTAPLDLARAALAAQGGEKFKSLKNIVLRGSVDLYGPNSTQSIPGGFVLVTAGDKVRMEVDARPLFSFKQIYDGQQSYSSLPGAEMPPTSKFGMRLLGKFEEPGYTVSALPDKKKQRGFRIGDAEGNATDFYLDPATGRVVSFTFSFNGYNFGTENKKFKDVEGVLVPTSFTQRIEMPQGAAFAEFNAKDIKVNQTMGDDVFALPN
ncbi:MAG: hypothetical protein QOJ88_1101 [Pyrinomonadaceae bacterium]|jgi:hypothetical protein|nr:hypothetical protein [Pyrinomonadaceae bacterium]MDQ1728263.1 hypothetical protein [Pyrinomonadaceae bacterium]